MQLFDYIAIPRYSQEIILQFFCYTTRRKDIVSFKLVKFMFPAGREIRKNTRGGETETGCMYMRRCGEKKKQGNVRGKLENRQFEETHWRIVLSREISSPTFTRRLIY